MKSGPPGTRPPDQEWTGEIVQDRYHVEALLGSGATAMVYRATDERTGRRVVLKVPHARLLETPVARDRFQSEMQSCLRLVHPHVVRVLDVGVFQGRPYAVYQHVSGGSLEVRLAERGGRMMPLEVLEWLPGAAKALDFVHRSGETHRDVKPSNLLFDAMGNVLLADVGLRAAVGGSSPGTAGSGEPAAGDYRPPEGLGLKFGPASDQYCLAALVYRALCGTPPAPTGARDTALEQVPRHVPRRAAQALLRSLDAEARDRYSSCGELSRAFEKGLRRTVSAPVLPSGSLGEPEASGGSGMATSTAVRRRSSLLLDLALILLGLATGMGGAYVIGRHFGMDAPVEAPEPTPTATPGVRPTHRAEAAPAAARPRRSTPAATPTDVPRGTPGPTGD
jgi:serine/threonine-protein kinase